MVFSFPVSAGTVLILCYSEGRSTINVEQTTSIVHTSLIICTSVASVERPEPRTWGLIPTRLRAEP